MNKEAYKYQDIIINHIIECNMFLLIILISIVNKLIYQKITVLHSKKLLPVNIFYIEFLYNNRLIIAYKEFIQLM